MPKREYWHPDGTYPVSAESVRDGDRDFQKEVMGAWFLENYEDPVQSTPYESAEGGYIYIWGGPYQADEELGGEFHDLVPEDVISELVAELEEECIEWSGKPDADRFDDYYLSVVSSNTEFHETLAKNLEQARELLDAPVGEEHQSHFLRLIYVSVVTALETFLSDCFINTISGKPKLLRKFVETNPEFQKRKLTLSEIFSRVDEIEEEVRSFLMDLLWHNLEKIKPMYQTTLGIDFPDDLKPLFRAVVIRHDIVHRNGKSKDGEEIELNRDEVEDLISQVEEFGRHIDGQFDEAEF